MKLFPLHQNILTLLVLVIVLGMTACAGGSPSIQGQTVQHVLVESAPGVFSERLSVFVFFNDPDGTADFESIRLIHDDTGLVWTLRPEDCTVRLRGKDRWTGSANIAGPRGGPLPEGGYSIFVRDLSGKETSTVYTLSSSRLPKNPPASFALNDGRWTMRLSGETGAFRRVFLFLYNADRTLLYSWRVPVSALGHAEGSVESLRALARDTVTVQCYIEDQSGTSGVLLFPAKLD